MADIDAPEALQKARTRILAGNAAGVHTVPMEYHGGAYLADDPKDLFFSVQRDHPVIGGDEIIAIGKRDGAIVFHGTIGD